MAKKRSLDEIVQINLRLTERLRRQLERKAAHVDRPMNSEIVRRLEASLKDEIEAEKLVAAALFQVLGEETLLEIWKMVERDLAQEYERRAAQEEIVASESALPEIPKDLAQERRALVRAVAIDVFTKEKRQQFQERINEIDRLIGEKARSRDKGEGADSTSEEARLERKIRAAMGADKIEKRAPDQLAATILQGVDTQTAVALGRMIRDKFGAADEQSHRFRNEVIREKTTQNTKKAEREGK